MIKRGKKMRVEASSVSGGGSIKSGTIETTTAGQELTIDTGLSSINRFSCIAYNPTYSSALLYHEIIYDPTSYIGAGKFYTATGHSNGNLYDDGIMSIGSAQTQRGWVITSISGGTITIKIGSVGSGWEESVGFWAAE